MGLLLAPIAPTEQHHARQVLRRCLRIKLDDGATLRASELPPAKLLVVERGIVQVVRPRPESKRPAVLALAGPGAVLLPPAGDELLGGLTTAVVIFVPAAACQRLLDLPSVAEALVDALLDTLRERQQTLALTNGATHSERLRETLLQLALVHGKVGPEGVEIQLPLTHELLARMIGSARETVTTTLAAFERDGLLSRDDGVYRLTVPPELIESELCDTSGPVSERVES
jgi:Crp-like helix-turn-helix domain